MNIEVTLLIEEKHMIFNNRIQEITYCIIFSHFQVHSVTNHKLTDRMESFFLAETTKYLYLLFAEDHFIHNTGGHGTIINSSHGQCIIDAGMYM